MWKDQKPASINAYLRQKRQVAESEAARNVFTEQNNALDAPIQEDVGGVDPAFCVVERVAFDALSVVRVKVLAATRDQLVVTHSGETRDFFPVRAGEWFARVAASRRRLADQPDLVRLDLFLFHDLSSHGRALADFCEAISYSASEEGHPAFHPSPTAVGPFVFPDARLKAPSRCVAREGNTILHVYSTETAE